MSALSVALVSRLGPCLGSFLESQIPLIGDSANHGPSSSLCMWSIGKNGEVNRTAMPVHCVGNQISCHQFQSINHVNSLEEPGSSILVRTGFSVLSRAQKSASGTCRLDLLYLRVNDLS